MAGDKHGAEETQEQEAAQKHGNEQAAQDQQEVTASSGVADATRRKYGKSPSALASRHTVRRGAARGREAPGRQALGRGPTPEG